MKGGDSKLSGEEVGNSVSWYLTEGGLPTAV